ncbi:MAG: hypothetical protein CMJ31_06510 [Phycisphaerae bacterium]|nr:hypothetical protein [Phycisphaerae bacterium]
MHRSTRVVAACIAGGLFAGNAEAQFAGPINSMVVEVISGALQSAPGAPTPVLGDEIAAVFGSFVIGVYGFTATQSDPREYSMDVFGDDEDTVPIEGPNFGDEITFQFYDASTNMFRTDVRAVNSAGEVIRVTYQGEFSFNDFPINLPGLPSNPGAPRRELTLVLGLNEPTPGGGGNGGGGNGGDDDDDDGGSGGGSGSRDFNGDGRVDAADAAAILRAMIAGPAAVDGMTVASFDVDGDGSVTTLDAVALLRERQGAPSSTIGMPGSGDETSSNSAADTADGLTTGQ